MRTYIKKEILFSFILSLTMISSCQPNSSNTSNISSEKTAFKGYEIYTWMDNDKQVFALLEGTNRAKEANEILNAKIDFETLKKKISNLAKNEFVTLVFAGMHQSLFPAKLTKQMEDELKKICSDKGINLNL